ncbi:MAG TPA: hypothetical protein DCZ97_05335 [Syntrophus sp. (in: bacteria)]|nr:hypothetical protein [Syntrophus sp. (in: bacteria)]
MGKFPGRGILLFLQPYFPQGLLRLPYRFLLAPQGRKGAGGFVQTGQDGQENILKHGHPRKDIHHLERPADPHLHPFVRLEPGNLFFPEINGAPIREHKTGQEVDEGGLPRPVGSDDRSEKTLLQG